MSLSYTNIHTLVTCVVHPCYSDRPAAHLYALLVDSMYETSDNMLGTESCVYACHDKTAYETCNIAYDTCNIAQLYTLQSCDASHLQLAQLFLQYVH